MPQSPDIFAPGYKNTPFWWEAVQPTTEGTSAIPAETDVAIVGGGYAGLSAALELARRGTAVTVLEADEFGRGPSSRNGGIVISTNVGKGTSASRQSPVERALGRNQMVAFLEAGAASVSHLEAIIEREKIDCSYMRTGHFLGAFTPKHFDGLADKVDLINETGNQTAELIPRNRQHEVIATDFYHGGMLVSVAGSVHPALLQRGLIERCRTAGVTLCANTRVTGIQKGGRGFVLETAGGRLEAREVVVATNGLTGSATPWHRRRLVPIASHMIATEELPEEKARGLIPQFNTIADTKRVLNYYRMSPDGRRVLFGGRARFTEVPPEVTAPLLHRMMLRVFPQIEGVKVTHAWSGNVAFAFDFLPHIGRHEGIHYCLACNGAGVALLSWLGHKTALKILGDGEQTSVFDERPFPTKPFYTGNPWFLPMVGSYFRALDRLDRPGI